MRVQVTLQDEFGEKVDTYAAKFGMSRSSLCAMLVGLGIASFEAAFSNIEKAVVKEVDTNLDISK